MKRRWILIWIFGASTVFAGDFLNILKRDSVRPGLCVVVGCETSDELIRAQIDEKYVVQGLCADQTTVDAVRTELIEKGAYGAVSVSLLQGTRLPFVDNLVNATIVIAQGAFSREEVLRVTAPYGTALFNKDGKWEAVTKAYPKEMDEWSQPTHSASGSKLSDDELVAPPTRVQWLAQEIYDREQLIQLLSAGGRNFYTFKSGKIVARDAFNGTRLWEQESCGFPWAATEEFLFTDIRGKLATINAATGEVNTTDVKSGNSSSLDDGVIYSANGAYDVKKETTLWQNDEPKRAEGAPLVADGKMIILTSSKGSDPEFICRDAKTGKDLWRIPSLGKPKFCYRGKLLVEGPQHDEKITLRGKERTTHVAVNHCIDLSDGSLVWTVEFYLPTHHGAATMFCVDENVWTRPGKLGGGFARDEFWRSYDLNTGEILKEIQTTQSMHRCFDPRATKRFILGTGIDYLDHTTDETYTFKGARGDCGRGTTPANGMLYQFPNMCMCMGQIDGVSGISSHSLTDPAESELKLSDQLEKGPAFGTLKCSKKMANDEWSTLRGNMARRGSNQAKIPAELNVLWIKEIKTKPSSPVATDGAVYIALRDSYSIVALDAENGKPTWTFHAEGPIDSPPSLVGNAVVFGCEKGWVYVLRASDGQLAWRFRAAPEERLILNDGYPASAWPLHGSLVVENGVIYATAGHHNELDGGLFMYALDLKTGNRVWQKRIIRKGVTQSIDQSVPGDTGNTLLTSDGKTLYMELMHLDLKTGAVTKEFEMGKLFFVSGWPTNVIWGGPQGFLLDLSLDHYYSGHSSSDWHWGNVRANMIAVDGEFGYGIVTLHGREIRRKEGTPLFEEGPVVVFCAKQVDVHKEWSEFIPDEEPIWSVALPEGRVARSMIKTADQVIVAFQTLEEDGSMAGVILQLDPTTGEEQGRRTLSSPPRWDGLAASGNRLYLITENNNLLCLGEK